jgi:hypothetical protein
MKRQLSSPVTILFETFISSVFSTNSTDVFELALTNEEQN